MTKRDELLQHIDQREREVHGRAERANHLQPGRDQPPADSRGTRTAEYPTPTTKKEGK
jgi:hypothetical protein